MAEFNVGFVGDIKNTVNKNITQSVTGLAETALGNVNKWREVLNANPDRIPFSLPPTLQGDIDRLNGAIAFTGLKLPSTNAIETDLKKALGDLVQPTLVGIDREIGSALDKVKGSLKDLEQISWLG